MILVKMPGRKKIPAVCMAEMGGDGVMRIKCGKCHRGNVLPILRDKCRVCGALVYRVDRDR